MTDTPENKQTREDNQRDFNAEIAGLSIGRIQRFLSSDATDYISDQKNGKARERMSLLDILLLTDPRYAELYADTINLIDDIDQAIAKTLKDYNQRLEMLETELSNIRQNANELPDGTRIYLSENGNVYTEDGTRLSLEESQMIEWREDHPSWERYTQTHDQVENVRHGIEETETYRDTDLKNAKDDIYNRNTPLDYDQLEERHDELLEGVPSIVRSNMAVAPDTEQKSDFAQQFGAKMAGATIKVTENDAVTPAEQPLQENSGSSFLSNFSQHI